MICGVCSRPIADRHIARKTLSNPPDPPAFTPETASARARPTMRDVAALAGVSLKTVSRVINAEPSVAPALVHRVNRAAAALDYRPNLTARSLRSSDGRTLTIGVVLEDVANPFSSALHRAVEDLTRARGIAVFAGSVDEDPDRERALISALISRRVDGLIIMPAGDDQSYLVNEQRAGLNLVFVDRPPRLLRADTVVSDNIRGAHEGVAHLIAHGHTRIAFLGDLEAIPTATERFTGYRRALAEAGIALERELVAFGIRGPDGAEAAVRELLEGPRPTALFTAQNLITTGAVRALRTLGLRHQIALVGFDDFALSDLLEPPVSVVAQDPWAIGSAACQRLFERMDGDAGPPRSVVLATRLLARGSGEIRPP
jgi:LacI family transcriptional regulator